MLFKPDDEFMAAYERAEENELCHASRDDDEEAASRRRRRTALAVGGGVAAGAAITAAVMGRRTGNAPDTPAPAAAAGDSVRVIRRGARPGAKYANARSYYSPDSSGKTPSPSIREFNSTVGGVKAGRRYKVKSPAKKPLAEPSHKVTEEFEKLPSTKRLRARKL